MKKRTGNREFSRKWAGRKQGVLGRIKKYRFFNHLTVLLVVIMSLTGCTEDLKPYLSNLNATADSPLYATYAAAMERSEFALDEGYEFNFYSSEKGINFTTDNAGELGIMFRIDNKWIYRLNEMYKPPVINISYPDMVKYIYYPVEDVEVEATFFTYSSHTAIWDFEITNNGSDRTIELLPFARQNTGRFKDVKVRGSYVLAAHSEYPDGWVLNHELPYHDTVQDIFYPSDTSFIPLLFNADHSNEYIKPDYSAFKKRKSKRQYYGRIFSPNGDRTFPVKEEMRLQAKIEGKDDILITENSPLWGNAEVINTTGLYRMELENLCEITTGENIIFRFANIHANMLGVFSEKTENEIKNPKRVDFTLKSYDLPLMPTNVRIEKNILTWDKIDDVSFKVYRREYPQTYYKLLVTQNEEMLPLPENSGLVGYIVVSEKDGKQSIHSAEATTSSVVSLDDYLNGNITKHKDLRNNKIIAFSKSKTFGKGKKLSFRIVRSVGGSSETEEQLLTKANEAEKIQLQEYVEANERLFSNVPDVSSLSEDQKMLYWSSFNMMRQSFLPPQEHSSYNYYVFSREPQWGWGHGGQVFHESIAMISYAYGFPESAMNSQRVYAERQYPDGYINYRTGSYLNEIIEHNGQLTSSAPWYAWLNWEVYQITGDKSFLKEMYNSSKKFYDFYSSNRDSDNDGLCEWGGHAVLESVRDALVAVWDEVGWPANFEGADINALLINEAKALEKMAKELQLSEEATKWKEDHEKRSELYNKTFWDDVNGFYYNVDKVDNDFTYKKVDDLKRNEIIGFLPLWAGIASEEQAAILVERLTDTASFWRPYGIPTLAANDPYYNAKGYWNGPVWVQWDYLVVQGLLNYGYKEEAKEIVNRVSKNMIEILKKNHNLWEFYSPDHIWAGYHKTYIWAGIINRMILDVNEIEHGEDEKTWTE